MQQLQVRYVGRVQGVGFRATVAELARSFAVTGRVCNVDDGSVDLQAEGEAAELVRFQQAIATRLGGYIIDAHARWSDIDQPRWSDFGIGVDKRP